MNRQSRNCLIVASVFFAMSVALGAFGAHGLRATLSQKAMHTFETGVDYQFLHAIALFIVYFIGQMHQIQLKLTYWIFVMGIIFFSFNCYIYALSGIKVFAMIVPVGGVLFLVGWMSLIVQLIKKKDI